MTTTLPNWDNNSALSGTTEETRAALRQLNTAIRTGIGTRHETYSKSYTDFTSGVASLFTLGAGESILSSWIIVTTGFTDSLLTPEVLTVVPSAVPTWAQRLLETSWPVAATNKDSSNSFYEPSLATGVASIVSAAAGVSLGIYDDSGSHVVCSNLTAGACTVHVLICTT